MRPVRPTLVYLGVAVACAGFALLGFTWAKFAALLNVALQLLYLVSGGLKGLAPVMWA